MKKIYMFFIIGFTVTNALAATSSIGNAIAADAYAPQYLVNAADAWASVINSPWRSGDIARTMDNFRAANEIARLYDIVSVLAFNHTAMTIFQTNHQLDSVYNVAGAPLDTRRGGAKQNFVINFNGDASMDKYTHHRNDDFETRTYGGGVDAYVYATNGLAFGIGYNYSKTKSHDMPIDTDVTGNIISLFSKYLGESGWFLNTTLAAGQSRWDFGKSLVGVKDETSFNANIYSAQISTGMNIRRGRMFFIQPEITARYTRVNTEKHTDGAAQVFPKWWFNTMNVGGAARVGANVPIGPVTLRPSLNAGAGYDIISNGTDNISTRVITGRTYDMPVRAPNRTAMRGGVGFGVYSGIIAFDAEYRIDIRNDYVAHNLMGNFKVAF